ncbi:fructose-6-phosphate aldolase [Streptococcus criceti]|uniref:Fructose-6-phosphate aldolase n=1 Tax=Streptococcus criceti HS-6 TaxID=873449 RepID=G5JSL7_STRCG|nr:fructose-6-phosphate aldolase [Streptococcus criceti]EHI74560.1 fructose-6-phosphate aldolase [Streptococcus criceti HS-6]SUN37497.1 fructose-6-phosphate aldolase [Streptococcus criceti]
MEFMLDTLNLEEIKKWAAILPLAGVTSNPSIAKKEGQIDFFEQMKKVRAIIGEGPSLHAQVVAEDVEGIVKDAHKLRDTLGGNLYIKIPVSPEGLTAIKQLKKEGFQITATAIYTVFQGLLAIEAGADYLAPYYNRMENLNTDPVEVISQLAQAIERKQATTKILAASFKNVSQMTKALAAGAQAVTAGADIFAAGFANPSIQKAVDDFAADWESTQGRSTI